MDQTKQETGIVAAQRTRNDVPVPRYSPMQASTSLIHPRAPLTGAAATSWIDLCVARVSEENVMIRGRKSSRRRNQGSGATIGGGNDVSCGHVSSRCMASGPALET